MRTNKFYKLIALILVFSTILPIFNVFVYAADTVNGIINSSRITQYAYKTEVEDAEGNKSDVTYYVAAVLIPISSIVVNADLDSPPKNMCYFEGKKEGTSKVYTIKNNESTYSIKVYDKDGNIIGTGNSSNIYNDSEDTNGNGNNLAFKISCDLDNGLKDTGPYVIELVDNATGKVISKGSKSSYTDGGEINKNKGFFARVFSVILDFAGTVLETVLSFIERQINNLLLVLGDGIVHLVSSAVGEIVTVDKLIFNNIEKTSINFWDKAAQDSSQTIVSVMKKAVNTWYKVFKNIAILVYIIVIIYVAIKILLASIGSERAKYMEMIKVWIVGICILLLFPYAMKYIVRLNEALVLYIGKEGSLTETRDVVAVSVDKVSWKTYGTNKFIESITGSAERPGSKDLMMDVRYLAAKNGRIPVTVVYLIVIAQTVIVLYMYYKRVFMLAFLITIFPLVAMTYTIDKMGDSQSQSFNIWLKEFMINVFVQSFHAVTYVLVANAGITVYVKSGNWLFMILCMTFLFKGEKILRSIFGAQSSANTIGDMASSGLAAYGVVSTFKKALNKKTQKITDEEERYNELMKNQGGGSTSDGSVGVQTAMRRVKTQALTRRLNPTGLVGAATKAVGVATKTAIILPTMVTGAVVEAAQGKDLSYVAAGAYAGSEVGKSISKTLSKPVKYGVNTVKGMKMKHDIESGTYDDELGLDARIEDEKGKAKQNALRKAYALQGRRTLQAGEKAGEAKFWIELEKELHRDS